MPSRLGRYAVRRRIGAGGFATVWLAYDEQLDSPVAVKVLADNWASDPQVRTRFVEEGRYLRRVESPHVVSVYDAGELEDGRPYLVMSYADQGTLADRVDLGGLGPDAALQVVREVGEGLAALHARGIVHRDVKPANVLFRAVDGRLRAMVGDLGLGRAMDASSRLTMVAGSPSYVAPEQARGGERPDARADQYSLAVVTHLLLSGRPPFDHVSLGAAADPAPVPALDWTGRSLPAAADDVVRRALSPDREERYADVPAYVAALAEALAPALRPEDAAGRLPVDPALTVPAARPAPDGSAGRTDPGPGRDPGDAPARTRPRTRPRSLAVVAAGLAALVGGVAGGWAVHDALAPGEVGVADATGSLSVTVPSAWQASVVDDGWEPPVEGASGDYPALAAGTGEGWQDSGEGVFVALLPGAELPDPLPQHPECETRRAPYSDTLEDGAATTVVSTGCPGGVRVERVVQVTTGELLWVQVRSADQATAMRVLDSVETVGL
ncbi:serine/threonine-protein kinase [Nocardioides sp. AX2bis]|uniref:serine/threonine-protein kinase n=1 Tax=Nocardioides sp. AX2bis TaxID=2653157 RepID=UPI001F412514|nr:serine/threonine-protein kinase [Nocardioides sp. AX2bis]